MVPAENEQASHAHVLLALMREPMKLEQTDYWYSSLPCATAELIVELEGKGQVRVNSLLLVSSTL